MNIRTNYFFMLHPNAHYIDHPPTNTLTDIILSTSTKSQMAFFITKDIYFIKIFCKHFHQFL